MTSFCSPAVDDLIYEGLTGILRVIPPGEEPEKRQTYETLVHSVVGMYDSYRALEVLLEDETDLDGDIGDDVKTVMRSFRLAWNFVDNAYAFQIISRTKIGRQIIILPNEITEDLKSASNFRNYCNHLPDVFKNAAAANGFAPLFGWISYQATPFFKDPSVGVHTFFVPMISSSHLKTTYSLDMPHHSSETVFGFIDCISLHIKKNLHLNLSRLMQNITIFINNWQIENITTLIKKCEVAEMGLSSPFCRIVGKANLPPDHPINRHTIDEELIKNKVRFEVSFGR